MLGKVCQGSCEKGPWGEGAEQSIILLWDFREANDNIERAILEQHMAQRPMISVVGINIEYPPTNNWVHFCSHCGKGDQNE